jgi:hypothetical protein
MLMRYQSPFGVILKVNFSLFSGGIFGYSEWILEKSLIIEVPIHLNSENFFLCSLSDWAFALSLYREVRRELPV